MVRGAIRGFFYFYFFFDLGFLELGYTLRWSDSNTTVDLVLMGKNGAFCYILMADLTPGLVDMHFLNEFSFFFFFPFKEKSTTVQSTEGVGEIQLLCA